MNTKAKQPHRNIVWMSRLLVTFTLVVGAWAGVAWQLDVLEQFGPASMAAKGFEALRNWGAERLESLNWGIARFHTELKHAYTNGMM